MACTKPEARPDAEIVFRLLQRLIQGCCVWGPQAALQVSDLIAIGRTSRLRALRAIVRLRRDGLVSVDQTLGVVRLTALAIEGFTDGQRTV